MEQKDINNYIARQNNWIKANNIKEGSLVLVTRKEKSRSKGWDDGWVVPMKVGGILQVRCLWSYGIILTDTFGYPNTSLLPLEGNAEDYIFKHFYDHKGNIQICLVQRTKLAEIGEFGWQQDSGNKKPCLRKFYKGEINIDEMFHIFSKKGYYPANYKNFSCKKVVASTLTGIGLPIIKLPDDEIYIHENILNVIPNSFELKDISI